MPWWIMAAHRAEGAPGRVGVVGTLITVVGTPSELVRSIFGFPGGTLNNTPYVLLDGHDDPAPFAARGRRGFELLMLVLTLPRLASIFTDCSVTDPYDCVARQGCGW